MVEFVYTPFIWPLLLTGIIQLWLAVYCFRHRDVSTATALGLLLFCGSFWAFQSALQVSAATLWLKIVLMQALFIVVPFISFLELYFVLHYLKKEEWINGWRSVLLLVIPVLTVLLALTAQFQTLWRYNFSVDFSGPFPVLLFSNGAGLTLYVVYSYVIILTAFLLLLIVPTEARQIYRRQRFLILAGLALPTAADVLFQLGITPIKGFAVAPLVLVISGPIFALAIFRYGFLQIAPVTRTLVVESMSAPMIVIDPQGKLTDMNRAASAVLDVRPESVLGRPAAEVFAGYPALVELFQRTVSGSREIVTGSGPEEGIFEGTAELLADASGANLGSCILLRDITRRTRAEAALRESEKRYRDIFEINNAVMFIIDPETGKITEANAAACRYYGYTKEEFAGLDIAMINIQDPDITRKDMIYAKNSPGEVFHFRHRKKNGEIRDVEVFSAAIMLEGHQILHSIIQDVTDRRIAEEALKESEEKYRTIVENMQDMFFRTDLAGKITMISPSGAKIAGYSSPDQLIGRDASEVYADPDDRDIFLHALRQNGSLFGYPATMKTRDGTIRHTTISSHFFRDARGNVQGVEGVIHDITDLRRAEEALRTANKKLGLLSGITRHDIRNQLTALKAYLQLCEDSITNPAELKEYLGEGQKITDTIDRQIEFTRDYEGMGVNAPAWQSVSSCIGSVMTDLPMRNIYIDVENNGLEVFADPLLEKVFYNLADNALRHGGDHLTTISITSRAEGTSLVLVFEDDGAGIAAKDKPLLFSKGFGKNTGLGLFLSREILSITGITIAENGEPGKGARFEITVPKEGYRFTKLADS